MLKIYGSMLCPDCVKCREDLDRAGVAYEYLDFSEHLLHLKEFLVLRDSENVFEEVRSNGKIGIPCIVMEDGRVTLDWAEFL
jgi:glutaredoxin-related protein